MVSDLGIPDPDLPRPTSDRSCPPVVDPTSRTRAVRLVGQWKNWRGSRRTGLPAEHLNAGPAAASKKSGLRFLEPDPRRRSTPGPLAGVASGAIGTPGREEAGRGRASLSGAAEIVWTAICDGNRSGSQDRRSGVWLVVEVSVIQTFRRREGFVEDVMKE